eukprot:Nk52_evm2s913 gene=Nk52_evmTU2s913
MVKAYLRYENKGSVGVIASPLSNIICGWNSNSHVLAGALENVTVWDLRKSTAMISFNGTDHVVTKLARSPDQKHVAVGYENGTIKVFEIESGLVTLTFNGHTGAITALAYDEEGWKLVSGASDTDVIVWDVLGEKGLYKLQGHKGPITKCHFIMQKHKRYGDVLVTSSKDSLVKVWDLDTQHCMQTITEHRGEVWDFVVNPECTRMITGSVDNELRVYAIGHRNDSEVKGEIKDNEKEDEDDKENAQVDLETKLSEIVFTRLGSVYRESKDRVVEMNLHGDGSLFACVGGDRIVELYAFLTAEEIEKKIARKMRRLKEKAAKKKDSSNEVIEIPEVMEKEVGDEIKNLMVHKMPSRIVSVDFSPILSARTRERKDIYMSMCLQNNSIENYRFEMEKKKCKLEKISTLEGPGHRSDIRASCLSSDDLMIATTSNNSLKIWNRSTGNCIRTVGAGYGLCVLFVPGNRHVLVGTKEGEIQIFDIASSVLVETIEAHKGALWSMDITPDKRGIVTGGADKEVKFWNFELVPGKQGINRLTLSHARTLKMDDDVMCVKFSPDHKYIAVATLDCTVKVFYADSLNFYLSLYGHKLPVLCMDVSSDGMLIATGSADKNIKLWGLDFGDCHKSIFAHQDSVTAVKFISKTHYFFTAGKDKMVKYWDADTFDNIMSLEGHKGEVWCLAASSNGEFVVSGSQDRSLRIWEKTEEQLFLEEEREFEREKQHDRELEQQKADESPLDAENNGEVAFAGKRTIDTIKGGESLIEAIDVVIEEQDKLDLYHEALANAQPGEKIAPPPPNPLFIALKIETPIDYLKRALEKVRSSDLEEALMVLPFSYVLKFFTFLDQWLKEGYSIDLTIRCTIFLLRIHQNQIITNEVMVNLLDSIRTHAKKQTMSVKATAGFNLAALHFLKRKLEEEETINFFSDASEKVKAIKKRKVVALRN